MCLSVIGEIIYCNSSIGKVKLMGIEKEVSVELIENPVVGDKVLIHAGFAIAKLSHEEAGEIEEALLLMPEQNIVQ